MTEQTRKDKIRAYKETPKQTGVYRILNTTNGKSLIGAARDLRARMNRQQGKLCTSYAIAPPSEIATGKAGADRNPRVPARRQYSSYGERRQHRVRSERRSQARFQTAALRVGPEWRCFFVAHLGHTQGYGRRRASRSSAIPIPTRTRNLCRDSPTELKLKSHPNAVLLQDWQTCGTDAFKFEVLDTLEPPQDPRHDPTEDLNVLETLWREKLQPFGY